MFIAKNKVRMHDTDMVGIIFFARQFRFMHEAIEELYEKEGLGLGDVFDGERIFVIVHAESDYLAPLHLGDNLEIRVWIEKMGETSIIFASDIYKGKELVGKTKVVKVCIDKKSWKKAPLPHIVKERFKKYLLE